MGETVTQLSYTDTHVVDFADGARIETTTTYYPPPVAPPSVEPRLAGVHDARAVAVAAVLFPGTSLAREFINGVQTGPRSLIAKAEIACRPSWNIGIIPIYSLKLNLAEVMAGTWDAQIRELADWHVDQPPAELVIQHEPENDTTMQGGAFPRYFNHIAAQFRTANDRMMLLYAAMLYQWLPGSVNGTIKGFTSSPADWKGVDCDRHMADVYSGNSAPLATILPEHKGFQRWMELIVGDRPWGVAERGFVTATDHKGRSAAIAREKDWLLNDPVGRLCRRYVYWNTAGTENNPAIVVDQSYGEPAVRDLVIALNS